LNVSKGSRSTIIGVASGALMMAVLAPSMVMAGGQTIDTVKVQGNVKVTNPTNGNPLDVDVTGNTPVSGSVNVSSPIKTQQGGQSTVVQGEEVPNMGLFNAAGAPNTIPVSTFGGGGGFLGAIDCTTENTVSLSHTVDIAGGTEGESDQVVTGIISYGTDAQITIASGALNINLPVVKILHNSTHPYQATALGNGLTLTDDLRVTCRDATGANDGTGGAVIIGQ
jgi:hypothetical protein